MSYALYELAMNEDIQEQLRTQLQETMEKHDGKLTYQALQSVNYLDMIFSETLRKYPVYPFLDRTCTKTYRVPGTDIVLDKGVFAFTSILGIQRDPQYFPEPERFDPERFSDANRRNIPSCCFMSFGEGPHKCLGLRLGYLQGKLGIAHIILNYRVHPCASTPKKMEFNLHSFLITPRDGVPLKFTRVTK
ncbi:hypothetical protein R5R35_000859 [Gryllus longicercus]|uniref:Cytochrome P450 n=2 Tax=Gryllus longicercus TaxID=2509291 RepID=A0AAN9VT65_9ORTH